MTLRYIEAQAAILCILFVAAYILQFLAAPFLTIEKFFARFAQQRGWAVFSLAISSIVLRVILLPWNPVPAPEVHDEFSYLLAGDTFAHGRLTNPPHAMWLYLDTFHVNQHPTYSSIFPPAQGAMLAIGQLLGHPWIGVLLSVSLMCAAVLWALQGWLPPSWALFGGVLMLLRLATSSYWVNSYWGGAVAAVGGALVIGALPRLIHFHRTRDALILGLGTAILANSRPFEGLVFCIPVAIALIAWLCGRRSAAWRETLPRLVLPLCLVMALCGLFMGYYNWRLTGNPLLFPHVLNIRTHCAVPQFAWQKTVAPFHFQIPEFESYYNFWWPSLAWPMGRPDTLRNIASAAANYAWVFVRFFIWPDLFLAVIVLPWILCDRRMRILLVQFALCFAAFLLVAWFQPHYAAPLTATTFILITQGFRHIRQRRFGSFPVGAGLVRAVALLALLFAPFHHYYVQLFPAMDARLSIASQIAAVPGNSLVLVRYSPSHNPLDEWVYDRAEVDRSKIVWAREIPNVSTQPLLDYFPGRNLWLVEPDEQPPKLFRVTRAPAQQ